ncbi:MULTISPECIES: flagellar biosynthesis protein FlhA [Gammaproteobacteria]|uniref:Flagellar biosynthesis protein FlhA n=1 Tax=Vreelandella halophila TaxID=86177 RepID=A0A9X4YCL1_9GAMM|nr:MULTISPECIES: flagellar biosynthesis protein FlhA [Gammaproteobacteria]KAA8984246.1 flagellar biosynthesis protein FlhA [Halospina sp. K52047b]MYL27031.1 flagellar biosynthesis protein FlhA [Halomonas utahensis]MYL75833.1 flagellar biosynthesis protein FlhA [Halomonas sp. 22501_18_FS]
MDRAGAIDQLRGLKGILDGNVAIPFMLMVLLGMMTLPIPVFLLDVAFTFNIALSLVIILVAIYAMRPMDFAAFPTVLLVATLLRLALNVASTRIVLLHGHEGGAAAGKVIESFGEVLIGGNYAVGLVVFAILMIINFIVVTKGAGRVSEVSARFTLDAMPGKQMAIDADLNAGLISQDEARDRRAEVAGEADFYGSMDGASKFVRGDAIAGLLILFINIVGGVSIGMFQHGLAFGQAVENYALLTIGDGLVAQIPSLLLSAAAAIIVTRVGKSQEMSSQVVEQMFSSPNAIGIAGGILIGLSLIPGMPTVAFMGLGGMAVAVAWFIWKRGQQVVEEGAGSAPVARQAAGGEGGGAQQRTITEDQQQALPGGGTGETKELAWEDVVSVDIVGLEVGYRLIPLVDKNQGGQLLARIKGVRKKLSQDLGFLMPSVHIRDNLDLMPNVYRITLMGVTLAEAEIHPDRELAIDPGQVFGKVEGIAGKDPAFGLDATWIEPAQRDQAQTLGYTVVDASTVVATHLNQVLQEHAHELLGHEEVQKWLDQLEKASPKLAEELVPNTVSISLLLKVLQNLLLEEVPIRDMRSIAEAIVNVQPRSQDPSVLTTAARKSLKRMIVQKLVGNESEVPVITLDPQLEQMLLKSVQQGQQSGTADDIGMILEPNMVEKLQRSLSDAAQKQEAVGKPAILLVSAPLRPVLARFVRYGVERLHVLSYQEIPENKQVTIVSSIGQ